MKKTTSKRFTKEELRKIDEADNLKISPFREDGVTYGTPTWIWTVVVGGRLYVRPYHRQKSSWYKAAMQQKKGRIHAAGMIKNVKFAPATGTVNKRIDDAYREKYAGNAFLKPMIGSSIHAVTVRITPR